MTLTVTGWPGDANQDWRVDEADAAILDANWLASDATWSMGDFNLDGRIDDEDASIMNRYWHTDWHNPPAVPEPSSLVLGLCLLSGLLPSIVRKKRGANSKGTRQATRTRRT